MTVHLVKPSDGQSQTIREVGWRLRKEITQEAYQADMAHAERLEFPAYQWAGQARDGRPLAVTWVVGLAGSIVAAYEIQGGAS
jgi:hypothetical protein